MNDDEKVELMQLLLAENRDSVMVGLGIMTGLSGKDKEHIIATLHQILMKKTFYHFCGFEGSYMENFKATEFWGVKYDRSKASPARKIYRGPVSIFRRSEKGFPTDDGPFFTMMDVELRNRHKNIVENFWYSCELISILKKNEHGYFYQEHYLHSSAYSAFPYVMMELPEKD